MQKKKKEGEKTEDIAVCSDFMYDYRSWVTHYSVLFPIYGFSGCHSVCDSYERTTITTEYQNE